MTARTTTPTLNAAEQAAELLGLDTFDLGLALRSFAVKELERLTATVSQGIESPNFGRFQRLLRAAESCEAAWDDFTAAAGEAQDAR